MKARLQLSIYKTLKTVDILIAMSTGSRRSRQQTGEFTLIESLQKILKAPNQSVIRGIGDDAAIVKPPTSPLLICSDAMAENTHFRLDWMAPEELGHKALASCLSDIAAMNGSPLHALISLALRPGLIDGFAERLYRGLGTLARKYNVNVIGGDLVSSRFETFIDVTVIGESLRPITRSGARPDDLVAISGTPGLSHAGLALLFAGYDREQIPPELQRAHFLPEPRFDLLVPLKKKGLITSMIDISDGLASELHHLASQTGCGFEINENTLPVTSQLKWAAQQLGSDPYEWIWSGGEDYQLLMTLDQGLWTKHFAGKDAHPFDLTLIGKVTKAGSGVTKRTKDRKRVAIPNQGWTHF